MLIQTLTVRTTKYDNGNTQAAARTMDTVQKTYLLFGLKKRRDAIIALVEQRHVGEPFVVPFTAYMKNIGKKSLDEYSKIIIHILEYNIHLTFVTSNFVENTLEYNIEALTAEPDYRFRRPKTFLEWLTGPA